MDLIAKSRGVHWWVSTALIAFALMVLLALTVQSFSSQYLIEHKYWIDMLHSISADHAQRVRAGQPLPTTGLVRSWYVEDGREDAQVPAYLAKLPPGNYSTEGGYRIFKSDDSFWGHGSFHAVVVPLPPGRLITRLAIDEIEDQQNRNSWYSGIWAAFVVALVGGVIVWLRANLVRPVRDLAQRMQAMDPRDTGARLPTTYKQEEIQIIAQASNAHLDRVEQFIERERSLLDQASHEFRTPIAVISGAVDVLNQISLPEASRPALSRIENAVEDLSETMVALLYLAREPDAQTEPLDVTALHDFLPRVVQDHEYLLRGKSAQLRLGELEPTYIAAPEAMVRIAVSNLIRNAIENTEVGRIEIALSKGVICVVDSGSGFNPMEAARRYRETLRQSAPVRGQGLGLFLIGRICDRFDWKLSIDAAVMGGTQAHLDVAASVIPL